ncbi:MAG: DUF4157 domain-containing protein [Moorea sp. SIO2I5]|nr:DUF4157 domain-containing protein [Moorena sp. SIO2I5]
MRTLESGVTQPERGRREMGPQAKFNFGMPGERSRQGANQGGHQVVQPKRNMVQRRAQPLTGDTVITGESLRASRRDNQNKTGLPDRLKAGIENLSGDSMDDVRVHYNSDKPAQLNALAYTQGTEIHVAPGQEKHLAHEAWHVVQQKQGRVRPMYREKGVSWNDEKVLESEAEVMGKKAKEGDRTTSIGCGRPAVRQGMLKRRKELVTSTNRKEESQAIQCYKVPSDVVAGDLVLYPNYFTEETNSEYEKMVVQERLNQKTENPDRSSLTLSKEFINLLNPDSRNIKYHKKYFNDGLTDLSDIDDWATSSMIEHMFVNYNNNIYYGQNRRGGSSPHWPHPTLIGEDPNVTDAGLLHVVKESRK